MTDTDTTVVEQTLRISARPETVWRYWTDPRAHVRLVGRGRRARPAARRRVRGRDGRRRRSCAASTSSSCPTSGSCSASAGNPTHGAPAVPPGSTRVEVTLTPDGDDTILALRHTGLPPAAAAEHGTGWGHFLPLLAAAAGGGDAAVLSQAGGGGRLPGHPAGTRGAPNLGRDNGNTHRTRS